MRCTCALALPVAPHTSTYPTHLSPFPRPSGLRNDNGQPGQPGRRGNEPSHTHNHTHTHTLTHTHSHTMPLDLSFLPSPWTKQPRLPDLWSCRARDQREGPDVHICKKGVRRAGHPVATPRSIRTLPRSRWPVCVCLPTCRFPSICVSVSHLACRLNRSRSRHPAHHHYSHSTRESCA